MLLIRCVICLKTETPRDESSNRSQNKVSRCISVHGINVFAVSSAEEWINNKTGRLSPAMMVDNIVSRAWKKRFAFECVVVGYRQWARRYNYAKRRVHVVSDIRTIDYYTLSDRVRIFSVKKLAWTRPITRFTIKLKPEATVLTCATKLKQIGWSNKDGMPKTVWERF